MVRVPGVSLPTAMNPFLTYDRKTEECLVKNEVLLIRGCVSGSDRGGGRDTHTKDSSD